MTSKLHNFPVVLNLNSKGRRHKLKSKGKSPHDIKTHHNLYIAYIKGNTRRIKPTVKNTNYNALNKTNNPQNERRLNTSLNPMVKTDHARKSSHGVPESNQRMLQSRVVSSH